MSSEGRHLFRIVLKNFFDSFKPRQIRGNNIGKDYIGNVYYEIPARPSEGKRKPVRWYDPPKGHDDFHGNDVPAEWESWLRMRRTDPPTEDEIAQNMAIAQLKKENAAKLEAKRLAEGGSLPVVPERGPQSFPSYSDMPIGDPDNTPKQN